MLGWTVDNYALADVPLYRPTTTLNLYTNASLSVWGAELNIHTIRGTWLVDVATNHINVLRLQAVLLALTLFQSLISQHALLGATNNTIVLAYIEKQGGTHSSFLCSLALQI